MFSQRGSGFPWMGGGRVYQRAGELEAHQMVAVGMGHPHGPRPQVAGCLGQRIGDGQGRARYLQQNLRGERQRAAHGNQRTAGGDIERGGKLQNLPTLFVATAHEYRYGDGKTGPLTTLCFGFRTLQTNPFWTRDKLLLAPWGPNQPDRACRCGQETRCIQGDFSITPPLRPYQTLIIFSLSSPTKRPLSAGNEAFRSARFCSSTTMELHFSLTAQGRYHTIR